MTTQRFDCRIELDTERTIENMKSVLVDEFGIWGGMSLAQDELNFSLYDKSMSYAMSGLHTLANLLATIGTEYIVSIWESGTSKF